MMKVCMVGVGSIAKRHIINIKEILGEDAVQVDVFRRTESIPLSQEIQNIISNCYTSIEEMDKDYDVIFITNPTEKHRDTLLMFQNHTKAFFVEKPVFSCSGDLSEFKKDLIYYVACPLRYTEIIQYVKNNISPENVLSVRCISSSYLPDWRPGIDYRNTYSAHKNLGGGVALDLIHEWDYLTYLFGFPIKTCGMMKRVSDLDIDCEDIALYLAEYNDKLAEIHLDYFGRQPIRLLELYLKDETIICDLIESSISFLREGRKISFKEKRNDFYKKELEHFLKIINEETDNDNNLFHANHVLQLAEGKAE